MDKLKLTLMAKQYAIHRLAPDAEIPHQALKSGFYALVKTSEELSLVCESHIALESQQTETGWSGIQVVGPLDFNLTGILAELSAALAEAGIGIFAISTYDTDYLLVRSPDLEDAVAALEGRGHQFQ